MNRPAILRRLAILVFVLAPAHDLASQSSGSTHRVVRSDDVAWRPAGPGLSVAVVEGDTSKPGPLTMMLRLEDGARIQPHWHNADKRLLVLSGELLMGMGDTVVLDSTTSTPAGSFALVPAGMHHYEAARGQTTVALLATGPFQTTFVK